MPIHLLGKKSWNVYNTGNIARVRRDEDEAIAREAAKEQKKQDSDTQLRMRLLRCESSDDKHLSRFQDLRSLESGTDAGAEMKFKPEPSKQRRKRRRGEDDTDRDIRYAQRVIDKQISSEGKLTLRSRHEAKSAEIPVVDHNGNIDLFAFERRTNYNDEQQKPTDRRSTESSTGSTGPNRGFNGTLRLTEAHGHQSKLEQRAWQRPSSLSGTTYAAETAIDGDVKCGQDIKRLRRNQARMTADDPLVMMRRGVQQVRMIESKRQAWREERFAELNSTRSRERPIHSHSSHHGRRRDGDQQGSRTHSKSDYRTLH